MQRPWSRKGSGVSGEPRQPFFQQLLLLSLDPRSVQSLPGTTANMLEPWVGLGSDPAPGGQGQERPSRGPLLLPLWPHVATP